MKTWFGCLLPLNGKNNRFHGNLCLQQLYLLNSSSLQEQLHHMYVGNTNFLLLIPKGTLQKYMFISRANIFFLSKSWFWTPAALGVWDWQCGSQTHYFSLRHTREMKQIESRYYSLYIFMQLLFCYYSFYLIIFPEYLLWASPSLGCWRCIEKQAALFF